MRSYKKFISILIILVLSIGIFSAHASAADYENWKQYDSRWSGIWLGNNSSTSMGKIGCRVTAIAIVAAKLNLVDGNFTPGTFANSLKNVNAFTNTGAMYNWTDPGKVVSGLEMVKKVSLSGMSQSEKASVINTYTTNGYACTICVKSGGHYVAANYVSGDTVYIHDPGYNRSNLFASYKNGGITSIRVFKRQENVLAPVQPAIQPTQTPSPEPTPAPAPATTPAPVAPAQPTTSIRFELETIPSGNLPYGKPFTLKGWFRSDSPIVEARAYMLDANQNIVMQSDKASSTTSNYQIQGYKLDKAMKFNQLSPGGYYLKYFVRDANGDTATWISDMFYIVK